MDHIRIEQKKETLEFINPFNQANTYYVRDQSGRELLLAEEYRHFLLGSSAFTLRIRDQTQEIFTVKRRLACVPFGYCFPRLLERLVIEAATGEPIGTVDQVRRGCSLYFTIKDEAGQVQLSVRFPSSMSFCSDMAFEVVDVHDNVVGEIRKKWAGFAQEAFTNADNFGVSFPVDLDVKFKALLISVTFLLVSLNLIYLLLSAANSTHFLLQDFMYFEKN